MKRLTLIFSMITLVGLGTSFILSKTYAKESFPKSLFNHLADKIAGPLQKIELEERLSFAQAKSIEVKLKSGDLNVTSYEGPDIKISVNGEIRSKFNSNSFLTHKLEDGQLKVEINAQTLIKKKNGLNITIDDDLNVEIAIPTSYSSPLFLSASSGDMKIKNLNMKSLDINTASGDIKLEKSNIEILIANALSGDIELTHSQVQSAEINVASGDVKIKKLASQQLKIEVLSGDTDIDAEFSKLDIDAASGDVEIRSRGLNADIKVSGASSDILLKLPPEVDNFILTAKTSSGDVDTKLVKRENEEDTQSVIFTKGKSNHQISLSTSSGDITIR